MSALATSRASAQDAAARSYLAHLLCDMAARCASRETRLKASCYLQQVIPWLSRLIDPAQIQTMIDTLDNTIQGSLTPINANLTRDLNQTVRLPSSLQT